MYSYIERWGEIHIFLSGSLSFFLDSSFYKVHPFRRRILDSTLMNWTIYKIAPRDFHSLVMLCCVSNDSIISHWNKIHSRKKDDAIETVFFIACWKCENANASNFVIEWKKVVWEFRLWFGKVDLKFRHTAIVVCGQRLHSSFLFPFSHSFIVLYVCKMTRRKRFTWLKISVFIACAQDWHICISISQRKNIGYHDS